MLNISWSTVDNHIQAAVRTLKADGRAEAARIYSDAHAAGTSERLPRQPDGLGEPAVSIDPAPALEQLAEQRFSRSFLPPIGGKENVLTPRETIFTALRVLFLAALGFIASVLVIKVGFNVLT